MIAADATRDDVLVADQCAFCKLLSGDGHAEWMWRGDAASALVPRESSWPGHTLVISNEHAVGLQDVSPDALHAVTDLVQKVSQCMDRAFDSDGVNVLNASGPSSGQSVPHLHFHIVPRWHHDGMDLWPHGQQSNHPVDDDWIGRLRSQFDH